MSRLNFAPKLNEIEITDVKSGIGTFTPKADKAVSFAALKEALKKAGYTLASAKITVAGKLEREGSGWSIAVAASGQRFVVEGHDVDSSLPAGGESEVTGGWETRGEGANARQVITLAPSKKAARAAATEFVELTTGEPWSALPVPTIASIPAAPIRTTSPGLTVYRGGAFTPRYVYTRQRLGDLYVDRHTLLLALSYTPTPRLQLEAEIPLTRISVRRGAVSSTGAGAGNITVSGKYRFFRKVSEWGDRQAAVRFGLELPTGGKSAPGEGRIEASDFVRGQLSPIAGGLSPHIDLAYSQARGRLIFGGNIEGVLRAERDGFRMGHELRINTDLEYVVFPFKYERPGGEIFAILETNFIRRGQGRTGGASAPGSSSTEYYLAPGIQYAAHPRFVIEASVQLPVVRNMGAQVLRVERGVIAGVRVLY